MLGRLKKAKPLAAVSVGVVALLVIGGGTAAAKALITGADIKDGTVTGADVQNHSLHVVDLGPGAVAKLKGDKGANGTNGTDGTDGTDGQRIVTSEGNGFTVKNNASYTNHGFIFGPFVNTVQQNGSMIYSGADIQGKTLGDLSQLTYAVGTNGVAGSMVRAPYLRVFIDNNQDGWDGSADDHDIVFDAGGPQGTQGFDVASGRLVNYDVTAGHVHYDDDGDGSVGETWQQTLNDHWNDKISSIRVSLGATGDPEETTDGFLNSLTYEMKGDAPQRISFSNVSPPAP